jgi:soluble lytic murein transglycosylase-like protein
LIAEWTQYWNQLLNPKIPLDPYLVKALIASESDFNPEAIPPGGGPNSARGLMQVTKTTRY